MGMRIIITGVTGMIGEGVLLECLKDERVTEVLAVSRKSSGHSHPKLTEYLVADFLDLKEIDPFLQDYDACFFCAGVSSVGMKEMDYYRNTYETTIAFARAISDGFGGDDPMSAAFSVAFASVLNSRISSSTKDPFRPAPSLVKVLSTKALTSAAAASPPIKAGAGIPRNA
jgi:nucleoside-diphosphate-sugar epimerase